MLGGVVEVDMMLMSDVEVDMMFTWSDVMCEVVMVEVEVDLSVSESWSMVEVKEH
jgi:hypothetical protein